MALGLSPTMVTHPRLLIAGPPVWRSPTELQIGLAGPLILLRQVPPAMEDATLLLDGRHHITDVEAVLGRAWTTWLIDRLAAAGLIADGGADEPTRLRVDIRGRGLLAEAIGRRIGAAGHTMGRRDADVVVLASDAAGPDRVEAGELTAAGIPHLLVGATPGHATVGPFVLPGRTCCLRCVDIAKRGYDAAWPVIAFQLARARCVVDPLVASWVATTVALQLDTYARGGLPDLTSGSVDLAADTHTQAWTAWPVQPECPCSHQRSVETGSASGPRLAQAA